MSAAVFRTWIDLRLVGRGPPQEPLSFPQGMAGPGPSLGGCVGISRGVVRPNKYVLPFQKGKKVSEGQVYLTQLQHVYVG